MNKLENISKNNASGSFVLSNLKRFERSSPSESPSVKMVHAGQEKYKVGGMHYALDLNHYLLVDDSEMVNTIVDSKEHVKGICIYPKKELLNEVSNYRTSNQQQMLDEPFEKKEIRLVHSLFNFNENLTGNFLARNIASILRKHENKGDINFDGFYMQLAEYIVIDQLELEGKLKQVSSVKRTTKEELYRRVAMAKSYITENYTEKINLDDLAGKTLLSKYHLLRTFKDIFQLSPYQYLLNLRLQKARELISKDYSYIEACHLTGFSDPKNLRKALKKINTK